MKQEKSEYNKVNQSLMSDKEEMPLKDNLLLSPIEKYKIYGRFPWKLIIHIFLVIATTTQGIMTISETTQYTRAQERLFYNFFITDSDKTVSDYARKTYLYSVNQVRSHLHNSIDNFYNFKSDSLEDVEYLQSLNDIFIAMEFSYLDKKLLGSKATIPRQFMYKVNNSSLGPFDYPDEDIKSFLNSVTDFRLNYSMKVFIPFYYGDHYECFHWNIHQVYNFVHRAHFEVNLQIKRNVCEDKSNMSMLDYFINRLMWVHIIVIMLASFSLILTWKQVYKMAKIYWRMKRKHKENTKKSSSNVNETNINCEEQLEIDKQLKKETDKKRKEDKKIIFNMWSVLCLVGNIVQVFGSALSLFDTDNVMSSTEILVGFGCMLAYINIGRYLEYNSDYSTIFETIKRAMPNVLRYLFGVIPIFFGFIFFGLCLFWRSERFTSTSTTMMTLFAMLNGDSVFDIFHDLSGVSFFIGQLYCYIFCIIFIVVVMNVFISIIEEAYVSTKMKNRNHWIYSYLKIDPEYIHIKDLEEPNVRGNTSDMKNPSSSLLQRHNKDQYNLVSTVKSKNILREAVEGKKYQGRDSIMNTKQDVEKVFDKHFANIEQSLNEIEKISKDVNSVEENRIKDELRSSIFDYITILEDKVSHLRNIWLTQS